MSQFAEPMARLIAELKKLPGIGDKLAERIIAHRPYKKVDDLEKVLGIGKKMMERLRPLVRIQEMKL